MVNLAITGVGVNKLLSTIRTNTGRFPAFLGLISFQGASSTINFANIMTMLILMFTKGVETQAITWIALGLSFFTAVIMELMVLVLHISNKHKESLYVLIILGVINFIKMFVVVFDHGRLLSFSVDTAANFLIITAFAALPAFGVYHLCVLMADDKQLDKVYTNCINLENDILIAEDKDDRLYVSRKELKAKTKKIALEAKYAGN